MQYYNKNGEPISPAEWSELFGNDDYRIIRQTYRSGYSVSTVWMGFDVTDRQEIFETYAYTSHNAEENTTKSRTIARAEIVHAMEILRCHDGLGTPPAPEPRADEYRRFSQQLEEDLPDEDF